MAILVPVALGGCQGKFTDGYLPHGITEGSNTVRDLWVGAWIALFAVGFLVWGLTFWCMAAYRSKKGDTTLPPQLQYNVPIEILYTVVPMLMIAVFFAYTARDESALADVSKKPDVTIQVVAKQWSWDFNYVDSDTYESGTQAELTGKPGVEKTLPELYVPVNKRVQFDLTARDVVHSFWVPAFLQKLDMVPGRANKLQVLPREEGTYIGKCAELCGAYHSQMLFSLKVVSQAEYDKHMNDLKARGNKGKLEDSLSRQPLMKGQESLLQNNGSK